HVAIVPIYKSLEQMEEIRQKVSELQANLKKLGITTKFDDDDQKRPGWKFAEYEAKGVPIRIAIGPRDLENNQAEVARRDTQEKNTISFDEIENYIINLLDEIQTNLFERANQYKVEKTQKIDSYE